MPTLGWPGTKNAREPSDMVAAPARALLAELTTATYRLRVPRLHVAVRSTSSTTRCATICAKLGAERATPHHLRRTLGTTVAALGFGRDVLNRFRTTARAASRRVYDRHGYAEEIQHVMEAVAARIMALVEGRAAADGKVVRLR